MKILFVCKHNVFRSKVSEAYFKKINKNKNIQIKSAGIIMPFTLDSKQKKSVQLQKKIAKEFGIEYKWSPKQLTIDLIREQDIIIISADDVPKKVFENPTYKKKNLKIFLWKIQDIKGQSNDEIIIRKSIKKIIKKLEDFNKKLK